jgi:PPIC-type PPIASE domain
LLRRLLREPFVHFAALALLIFAVYAVLSPSAQQAPAGSIVVSSGKIEQMAAIFARTWQRPPSPEELKGLIDDYVTEEIYVREALALGLDQDDTVIRRRLRQKMEFMTSADVDALTPTDAELQTYLDAHPDAFSEARQVAFQQVYLNPDRHHKTMDQDAAALLETLQGDPEADTSVLGDASLLPYELPLTSIGSIDRIFGPEVAAFVSQAEPGVWTGPVASPYGLHVIRVTIKSPGRLPALVEIRDAVLREWSNAKRQDLEAARLAELLGRYDIKIDDGSAKEASP